MNTDRVVGSYSINNGPVKYLYESNQPVDTANGITVEIDVSNTPHHIFYNGVYIKTV